MKPQKDIAYSADEVASLYERSERQADISRRMTRARRADFIYREDAPVISLPRTVWRRVQKEAQRRRTTSERLVRQWVREKLRDVV